MDLILPIVHMQSTQHRYEAIEICELKNHIS